MGDCPDLRHPPNFLVAHFPIFHPAQYSITPLLRARPSLHHSVRPSTSPAPLPSGLPTHGMVGVGAPRPAVSRSNLHSKAARTRCDAHTAGRTRRTAAGFAPSASGSCRKRVRASSAGAPSGRGGASEWRSRAWGLRPASGARSSTPRQLPNPRPAESRRHGATGGMLPPRSSSPPRNRSTSCARITRAGRIRRTPK